MVAASGPLFATVILHSTSLGVFLAYSAYTSQYLLSLKTPTNKGDENSDLQADS